MMHKDRPRTLTWPCWLAVATACDPVADESWAQDERLGAMMASGSESGDTGQEMPVPCTEHHECPTQACHLAGPDQGSCFAPEHVMDYVGGGGVSLWSLISGLTAGDQLAIRIQPGTFELLLSPTLAAGAELALIGGPGTLLEVDEGFNLLEGSDAIVYLDEIEVNGANGGGLTMHRSSVWIDDSTLGNHGTGGAFSLYGPNADLHMRRSRISGNFGPASTNISTTVDIRDSIFSHNLHSVSFHGLTTVTNSGFYGTPDESVVFGGKFHISYSTILGHHFGGSHTMRCYGTTGGMIRNSILANNWAHTLHPDCDGITVLHSAVDQAPVIGFANDVIGPLDLGWFVDPEWHDFHLAPGQLAISDVAVRKAFDPLVDIDGDPIPAGPSWPGLDQP